MGNNLVKHPLVRKYHKTVTVYGFRCPGCCDDRHYFPVGAAVVQPDGTLRCLKCSPGKPGYKRVYAWCSLCGEARPTSDFKYEYADVTGRVHRDDSPHCSTCAESCNCTKCHHRRVYTHGANHNRKHTCEGCGKEFTPTRRDARYCPGSSRCRVAAMRARRRESGSA